MKALLTAFALLSFVAASSLPMVASAEEMKSDQTMSKSDVKSNSASSKHTKSHKAAHKATHKKSAKKAHHKHMAKKTKHHDKDMTKTNPPKAG